MKNESRDIVSTQSRHPEVAEPQPNRSMQDLECYPAFGSSGSINVVTQGEKSSLIRLCRAKQLSIVLREVDLGGYQLFSDRKVKTHPRPLPNHGGEKKAAFTLAEVLITLAIIGVVAAMTIPTLVQGYKKKVTSTRLKQYYSAMLNAIALSKIDNGNKWHKASISENYDEDGTLNYEKAYENASKFFKVYLAPYFKYSEDTILEDGKVTLNNGTQIIFWHGECIDMNIDINGEAKPNEANRDIFYFKLCLEDEPLFQTGRRNSASMTREELVEQCKENEDSIPYCTELLRRDGWEFKDDYPYKL